MSAQLTFDIRLWTNAPGWADVDIALGSEHVTATCSWVFDSLGEIVRGMARLAAEGGKFEVAADSEGSGSFLLTFRRRGEQFGLTAKKAVGDLEATQARHLRVRLRHRGPWLPALRTIFAAYDRVLQQLGPSGFAQSWGYPFPGDAWRQLELALQES